MTNQLSEHITTQDMKMAEVLRKIVADKHTWVEERMKMQPLHSFQTDITQSDRCFYGALKSTDTAFIFECKKASPSKGLIRDDFDLDYIASVYNRYASAISVLTDEKYFQGNFDFIQRVRNQVTQPVLCKDFMISSYQVYLARYYQADAILLMLSVLDDETYTELANLAHMLGMGILTEASNEEEVQRAVRLGAKVVGINNRNLRDLTTDLNRTKHLAPLLPENVTIISESGIYNNSQVRDLSQYAHGFLIGSSLMSEDNLEFAVRKVIFGEVKVCGLTRREDAHKVYQSGAIYGGLIFVEQSPRYVSIEQARDVIAGAPLQYVGVFKNHTIEYISQTATALLLTAVQLHGNEDQDYVNALRQQLPEWVQIWKAYGVKDQFPELLSNHIDRHLCDSQIGHQSGGTGKVFDWRLLSGENPVMLAGGLSPENIRRASRLGCIGLDLNSGVEYAPGKKDNKKLQSVFNQLRQY